MKPIGVRPELAVPCGDLTCEGCYPNHYCGHCIAPDAAGAAVASVFSCRVCHSVYRVGRLADLVDYQRHPERYSAAVPRVYLCLENRSYLGPPLDSRYL